jgi:hypothetical protein
MCPFNITRRLVEEAKEEWKNDVATSNIIQQLQNDPSSLDRFCWKGYILWFKERLYLCKTSSLKKKFLTELHESPVGGHLGFLKKYYRVKKELFWEGLKGDVQKFVAECLVCQKKKGETIKICSLLQPIAIPS